MMNLIATANTKNASSIPSSSSFKKMNDNFTLLSQQRRNFDITLTQIRSELAQMEGALLDLVNVRRAPINNKQNESSATNNNNKTNIQTLEEAVTILSAEVDCNRRTLDALSRLHDEKQILLERHRAEHERDVRRLKNTIFVFTSPASPSSSSSSSSSIQDQLDELRQTEQRIRDLEDVILNESQIEEFPTASLAAKEQRKEELEKEKYLKLMIQNTETELARLDIRLRQVSTDEGEEISSASSLLFQKKDIIISNMNNNNNKENNRIAKTNVLLLKKGALQSKLNQKKMVVNRLTAAVDQIPKHLRNTNSNNNNNSSSSLFRSSQNGDFENDDDGRGFLSASLKSFADAHRLLSLVKASVCHLQDNFEEISSVITRFTLEKNLVTQRMQKQIEEDAKRGNPNAKKKGNNNNHNNSQQLLLQSALEMWLRDALFKILEDIQRQSVLVLDRHMMQGDEEEDDQDDDDDDEDEEKEKENEGGEDNTQEDESENDDDDTKSNTTTRSMTSSSNNNKSRSKNNKNNKKSTTVASMTSSVLTAAVDDLLKSIRKLTVLLDVVEPSLGKRSLLQQLQFADDEFHLLPQLLQITQTALEIRNEILEQQQQQQNLHQPQASSSSLPSNSDLHRHHHETSAATNVRTPSKGVKNFVSVSNQSPRLNISSSSANNSNNTATRLF